MKIYRYMNLTELTKLLGGFFIEDLGKWKHCNTTSKGVCFLGGDRADAIYALDFLEGIVGDYALVEFDAPESILYRSRGVYSCGEVEELYIPFGYDSKIFKVSAICYLTTDMWLFPPKWIEM